MKAGYGSDFKTIFMPSEEGGTKLIRISIQIRRECHERSSCPLISAMIYRFYFISHILHLNPSLSFILTTNALNFEFVDPETLLVYQLCLNYKSTRSFPCQGDLWRAKGNTPKPNLDAYGAKLTPIRPDSMHHEKT